MMNANTVMDNFMKLLCEDGFKKENQPNDGPDIDEQFIGEKVSLYSELLQSGIIEESLKG